MFNRIADFYLDMIAKTIANQFQQGLLGIGLSLFGGGNNFKSKNPTPTLTSEQVQSRFAYSDSRRANGGPVKGGNSYIVGERGPELFSPGVSGMITPNEMLGGSTSVVVNVDASGTSVEGDQPSAEELGRLIGAVVQSELIKEKRPGGLLG